MNIRDMFYYVRPGLFVLGLFVLGALGLSVVDQATAQAQGACTMDFVSFSGPSNPAPGDTATIRVNIGGCVNEQIKIQLYHRQGTGSGATSRFVNDVVSNPPTNATDPHRANFYHQFTLGESQCQSSSSPNCRLFIKGLIDGTEVFSSWNDGGRVEYNCDNTCGTTATDWGNPTVNWIGPNDDPEDVPDDEFRYLQNPIGYDNIPDVIRQIIRVIFTIGIPLVALAIIYAGFLLVTAGGSQEKIKKGKQALLAAVIGGAILLGAWVIAEAIQGTIDQIRQG